MSRRDLLCYVTKLNHKTRMEQAEGRVESGLREIYENGFGEEVGRDSDLQSSFGFVGTVAVRAAVSDHRWTLRYYATLCRVSRISGNTMGHI